MASYRRRPVTLDGTAENPSVTLKSTQHAVARTAAPPNIRTDLSALDNALGRFFGATKGFGDVLAHADLEATRIEERKAIEDRTIQARADAEAGKPMADDQSGFRSYYQTHSMVSGERRGHEMLEQFRAGVANLPPDANLDEYRDGFLREAAANMPRDNPYFQTAALSRFNGGVEQLRAQRRQDNIRQTIASGVQGFSDDLGMRLNNGDEIDLAREYDRYRALNPNEAHLAPQRVAQALMTAAGSNPAAVDRVAAMLREPGSGIDGRSYAESFPAAFNEHQQDAVRRVQGVQTREAQDAYGSLSERAQRAESVEDLQALMVETRATYDRFGGLGAYQSMTSHLGSALHRFAETTARRNAAVGSIDRALTNPGALDVTEVRKHLPEYRTARGIDLWDRTPFDPNNPARLPGWLQGANLIASLGVIDDDAKTQLSLGLLDTANPATQAHAFQVLRTIHARRPNEVYGMMTDDARQVFDAALTRSRGTSAENPVAMFTNMSETAQRHGNARSPVGWKQLMSATSEEAGRAAIDGKINAALQSIIASDGRGVLGTGLGSEASVHIPPYIADQLRNTVMVDIESQQRLGPVDIDAVTQRAAARIQSDLSLLPGTGGARVVTLSRRPIPGVRAGRGVMNPHTRQMEDTTATAENDLRQLAETMPQIGVDGRAALALQMHDAETPRNGVYLVTRGGSNVVFAPGQTLSFRRTGIEAAGANPFAGGVTAIPITETHTVPSDPAEVQKFFAERYPNSPFTLLHMETPQGRAYVLGYRFRFQTDAAAAQAQEEARRTPIAAAEQQAQTRRQRWQRRGVDAPTPEGESP